MSRERRDVSASREAARDFPTCVREHAPDPRSKATPRRFGVDRSHSQGGALPSRRKGLDLAGRTHSLTCHQLPFSTKLVRMDWLPRRMACFGLGVAAFGGGCSLMPWTLALGLALVALGVVLLGCSLLNRLWIGGIEIRIGRENSSADWRSDYIDWIPGLIGECPETAEPCTRLSCSLSCIKITNHGHYDAEVQRIWLAFMRCDHLREIEPLSIQKESFERNPWGDQTEGTRKSGIRT
jgi:hypothetical protein